MNTFMHMHMHIHTPTRTYMLPAHAQHAHAQHAQHAHANEHAHTHAHASHAAYSFVLLLLLLRTCAADGSDVRASGESKSKGNCEETLVRTAHLPYVGHKAHRVCLEVPTHHTAHYVYALA